MAAMSSIPQQWRNTERNPQGTATDPTRAEFELTLAKYFAVPWCKQLELKEEADKASQVENGSYLPEVFGTDILEIASSCKAGPDLAERSRA